MKKRMTALLLSLLLTLCLSAPALAAGFDQNVLNGVVVLWEDVVINGEYQGSYRGTAFFIGEKGKDPQYLVTNHHVIQHFLATGGGQGQSRIYAIFDDNNDIEEAYLVDYNEAMDLLR